MTERERTTLETSHSVQEVADALGFGVTTVYQMIKSGEIKAWRRTLRFGRLGPYRIDTREVERFKREGAWAVERKTQVAKVASQVATGLSNTVGLRKRGRQ